MTAIEQIVGPLPTEKQLGLRLRQWRAKAGLSTRQAARAVKVSHNVYYRAECGEHTRSDNYRKLVQAVAASLSHQPRPESAERARRAGLLPQELPKEDV